MTQREMWRDYNSQLALAIERTIDGQAHQAKRAAFKKFGLPLPTVEGEVACPCAMYPFPHFHNVEVKQRSIFRFKHCRPDPMEEHA